MGGRGAYSQKGGFKIQQYEATGEVIGGIKVIRDKRDKPGVKGSFKPPEMSNTPGTAYIFQSHNKYKNLLTYGMDRSSKQSYDLTHSHTNRPKNGKVEKLKLGVVHVHNIRGGRENNVRYMTKKEIKKYGHIMRRLGVKVRE